jgi:hypothetical protein
MRCLPFYKNLDNAIALNYLHLDLDEIENFLKTNNYNGFNHLKTV